MSAQLIVTRRLPTYEFVIRTNRGVAANSQLLENYIEKTPRPRGFWLLDPRLDGRVFGGTFELRQHDANLWGSMVPSIEGEIVPNELGSDVVVQVRNPMISIALIGVIGLLAFVPALLFGHVGAEILTEIGFFSAVAMTLGVVPVFINGSWAATVLVSVFSQPANG